MKQESGRRPRQLTSAPSGRPARPAPLPARQAPRQSRLAQWFRTSRLAIVLGVVVLATILTVMYYRITSPEQPATQSPATGTPHSLLPQLRLGAGDDATAPGWTLL